VTQDAIMTGGAVGAVIILARVIETIITRKTNGYDMSSVQRLYEAHLTHDMVQKQIVDQIKQVAEQQHTTVQVLNNLVTKLDVRLPRIFE